MCNKNLLKQFLIVDLPKCKSSDFEQEIFKV